MLSAGGFEEAGLEDSGDIEFTVSFAGIGQVDSIRLTSPGGNWIQSNKSGSAVFSVPADVQPGACARAICPMRGTLVSAGTTSHAVPVADIQVDFPGVNVAPRCSAPTEAAYRPAQPGRQRPVHRLWRSDHRVKLVKGGMVYEANILVAEADVNHIVPLTR